MSRKKTLNFEPQTLNSYSVAQIRASEYPGALISKSRKYPNGVCAVSNPAFCKRFSAKSNNSLVKSTDAFDSAKWANECSITLLQLFFREAHFK